MKAMKLIESWTDDAVDGIGFLFLAACTAVLIGVVLNFIGVTSDDVKWIEELLANFSIKLLIGAMYSLLFAVCWIPIAALLYATGISYDAIEWGFIPLSFCFLGGAFIFFAFLTLTIATEF